MKIALTGATGFIGRELVKQAKEKGWKPIVLVRPESDIKALSAYPVHVLKYTSLSDEDLVRSLKALQPEVFIQLGWKGVSGNERSNAYQFAENIPFTLASVQLAAASGCRQWIGTGSQAEYGMSDKKLSEEHACAPFTAYGKAKLAAGIAGLGLSETLNITGTWLRLFSVYGPYDHSAALIPYVITSFKKNDRPELTACEQQWDFLYVTDAASAYLSVAENGLAGVYNIGNGETVVLKKVIEYIREQVNSRADISYEKPYGKNQIMHLEADISKLSKSSEWKPRISLQEGISRTINYYLSESI